jgi:uncharacterized membrane protein YhaH (DUF805 family)
MIGYIAALLVYGVIGLSLVIRRLQDIGWNGWLALVGIIPLVNIIFALIILFKAGTPGNNKYGVPPSNKIDIWNTLFPKTQTQSISSPVFSENQV